MKTPESDNSAHAGKSTFIDTFLCLQTLAQEGKLVAEQGGVLIGCQQQKNHNFTLVLECNSILRHV
jgi:hypothetical protein